VCVCMLAFLYCLNRQTTTKKQRSRILQAYENKNILHTWRWPCRPKHVVRDSENQHNKAACWRKHNLCKCLSIWGDQRTFDHIHMKYDIRNFYWDLSAHFNRTDTSHEDLHTFLHTSQA
jgi:hypothetical protein